MAARLLSVHDQEAFEHSTQCIDHSSLAIIGEMLLSQYMSDVYPIEVRFGVELHVGGGTPVAPFRPYLMGYAEKRHWILLMDIITTFFFSQKDLCTNCSLLYLV